MQIRRIIPWNRARRFNRKKAGFFHLFRFRKPGFRELAISLFVIVFWASYAFSDTIYYDAGGNPITREEYQKIIDNQPEGSDFPPAGKKEESGMEKKTEKPAQTDDAAKKGFELIDKNPKEMMDEMDPEKMPETEEKLDKEAEEYAKRIRDKDAIFAIGLKAGTLGAGMDLTYRILKTLNLRICVNGMPFSYDDTVSDIDYELDLNLMTAGVLADWHPFQSGFRLSAGVLVNNNSLDLTASPAKSYDIDGVTYTPAQVGNLTGSLEFEDAAAYLGLGFGNAVLKRNKFRFSMDIGLLYHGDPEVGLSADGLYADDPTFQYHLKEEEKDLETEYEDYNIYPVIAFGFTYSF